jgi:hypothetical protein
MPYFKRKIKTSEGTSFILFHHKNINKLQPVNASMKRVPYYIASVGLSALAIAFPSACGRGDKPIEAPRRPAVQQEEVGLTYEVKSGDFLSKIVYNELGLRGEAIYDSLPAIQKRSGFGLERDVYKVVDGQLVSGQDGFVDLIYPGEKVVLK